jgi:protein ImuA
MKAPLSISYAQIAGKASGGLRYATGIASLDKTLAGGIACGRVHEIYAADADDAAGAAGFSAMLAAGLVSPSRPLIWLREKRAARANGILQAEGWAQLGGRPEACLFVLADDATALLRASLDAARCTGLGAVIVEAQGRLPALNLTASRRLSLAAAQSGVTLFLLRIDAEPVPSAAETRWSVASAPSHGLPGKAPGMPTFDIELLRQRSGPSGMGWRLEWDRDRHMFRDTALSGTVVPVPVRGPAADTGTGALRRVA